MLVVLGAYFYTPPESDEERQARARALPEHNGEPRRSASRTSLLENVREMFAGTSAKGKNAIGASASKEARPGETKTVVVAILSRMIITPLLMLPLMVLSTKFDWQEVFAECVLSRSLFAPWPVVDSRLDPPIARCLWCRTCC